MCACVLLCVLLCLPPRVIVSPPSHWSLSHSCSPLSSLSLLVYLNLCPLLSLKTETTFCRLCSQTRAHADSQRASQVGLVDAVFRWVYNCVVNDLEWVRMVPKCVQRIASGLDTRCRIITGVLSNAANRIQQVEHRETICCTIL